ncbi:MAG: CDP-alcohol phosphatidyltransferase family protein [Candidatus Methylomirabilia bacterium]
MQHALRKNLANLVVLLRTAMVLLAIGMLQAAGPGVRLGGLVVLFLACAMDWLDGFLARWLGVTSQVGGLLDTLADRITENLLFVFLAYHHLVPLLVPIFFICRSFLADFVRALLFKRGIGTFAVQTSALGRYLVSSKSSRVMYLLVKLAVFLAGGAVLVAGSSINAEPGWVTIVRSFVWQCALLATFFSLVRFVLLLYDSRRVLVEEFGR